MACDLFLHFFAFVDKWWPKMLYWLYDWPNSNCFPTWNCSQPVCECPSLLFGILYSIRACPCIPTKCGGDIGTWKSNPIVLEDGGCLGFVVVDRDGLSGLRHDLDAVLHPGDQPPGLCGILLQQSVALAAVQQVHTFSERGKNWCCDYWWVQWIKTVGSEYKVHSRRI